ncbi:MAG TPA: hypothetical protein VLL08_04155 [Kineosporiaceae bacterium]|nr:hypothetical protein [Kineosporiaceae bacterium]
MTQPIHTDPDRLDDLWRPEVGPTGTQPIPNSGWAGDPALAQPGTPPGGIKRSRRRRGGRPFPSLLLELVLAVLISAGVAAAMGWRVLSDLGRVIPGAGADPYIELWSLAWSGHALKPGSGVPLAQVFDGNAFYPADYSLAFTDSLLGYGPITWFFHGAAGLITAYNLIFVFAPALSSFGGYALARQLGAHPVGAAVAGAGFAYAPWHFGQFSHLHVLSVGPMVISLAMLARGHGLTMNGRRAPARPLWVLLGWLVGAWQLSIGFANGLPFGYLLALIGVLALVSLSVRKLRARRRRLVAERGDPLAEPYPDVPEFTDPVIPPVGPTVVVITPQPRIARVVLADLLGAAVFVLVGSVMAYPYLRVQAIDPEAVETARGLDQVLQYSPKPAGLVAPPALDGTWSWLTSGQTLVSGTNEIRLLPGAILIGLAVLGLAVSNWRWWWRLTILAAGLLVAGLCLGRRFPDRFFPGPDSPFVLLWRHVPGWAADRTPGRLIVFCTLALALLAAGAVSRFCGWGYLGSRARTSRLRVGVLLVLPILIVLEGWARIPLMPVPPPPAALTQAVGPTVVLPSVWTNDSKVMFWTATQGFPAVANGASGITPTTLVQLRAELVGFPDQRSVAYLRQNGFRSVVVLRTPLGTDLWQDADRIPDPALGLTRQDLGESLLYTLSS